MSPKSVINRPFIKREIPWPNVVAFHKEIARRAEESFFALPLGMNPSDRWSSIVGLKPQDFSGNWDFNSQAVISNSFRNLILSGGLGEVFIGGPCWVRSRKDENGWRQEWCPFFYRSIRIEQLENGFLHVIPEQGSWEISPIVLNVLDRKGFFPRKPLEELIPEFLEAASVNAQATNQHLTTCLVETICRELPDFSELFAKKPNPSPTHHEPTSWAIFSPPPTGPLTQHLVRDYDKLSAIVNDGKNTVGGLSLFEGFPDPGVSSEQEPTPIVPLNDSQRAAVKGVLESKPITVISGPPGCGKSQVVLSLMLNAWQRGISVLFASNNNQAVDVVRSRLERFESHFPIAIRAGSRKKSGIIQALADTLNFITGKKGVFSDTKDGAVQKRDDLLAKQKALKAFLDSKLPQRVDEAIRSALGAYAVFQRTRAELHLIEEGLIKELNVFGKNLYADSFPQEVVKPLEDWVSRVKDYREFADQDNAKRKRIQRELNTAQDARNRAVQRVGVDSSIITSWSWLVSGPGPELLRSWMDRYKDLLAKPLEQHLAPYEWVKDFEKWQGEKDASNWSANAKKLSSDIRNACGELGPKLSQIDAVKNRYTAQMARVQKSAIPTEIAVKPVVLNDWSAAFALEASLPLAKFDWLPWSQRQCSIRRMKHAEKILRSFLPLTVWRNIGKLNLEGRNKLSEIVELSQAWLSNRSEWEATKSVRDEIEAIFRKLLGRHSELMPNDKSQEVTDLENWQKIVRELLEQAAIADKATIAWRNRTIAEKATTDIRALASEFLSIASGVPIKETWTQGLGVSFRETLLCLVSEPSPQSVIDARAALYTDAVTILIDSWERAREEETLLRKLQMDIEIIPSARKRCEEWISEMPPNLPVKIILSQDQLPEDGHEVFSLLAKYKDWMVRWNNFRSHQLPTLQKRSEEEYRWAEKILKDAFDLLPPGDQKATTQNALQKIFSGNNDWSPDEIQHLFAAYSPNRIKANIDGFEAQIEEISFDVAKQEWLNRMSSDSDLQKALDDLHTHYKRNQERIEPEAFPSFKKALEAIPIWITTAQSPQSIPMLPDLFSILVIDEATQCTVTNILPLIYRARRLVVIGDKEQLPAIPNIGPAAESALAAKFNVPEDILDVVGHAENDLYRSAVRCLPRGRHDVIALEEHYRSHPLIIGFSNRHVYQTALKLRTDPANVSSLPFGSAVHGQHVRGQCMRGQFNQSWVNQPEVEAACNLVKRLRESPETRSRSLGIVTPFRAHMDAIADRLQRMELLDGVTVGTAHTYQGDERDIMIFSPVVAKGINEGAARWVENPKNLINVAVTRARIALFVVADFDICRLQEGILGELIKYVETVQKLRETSKEELELFSWMMVQGWNPQVHHMERDIEVDFILKHGGKRLALEVDGLQHQNTQEQDKARDTFLRGMGYDVLRIPARAIRETPSLVIKQIGESIGLPV